MIRATSAAGHTPQRNDLLAALPPADYQQLAPHLELVPLALGCVVHESGGLLEYVYFPTDCIVSLLSVAGDGRSAEIAIAGNDGLVGIALFMGGETASGRAVVQNAGYAYRVPSAVIQREFNRGGALQLLLLRYTQALITQMSQTALCNRHHSLEQQLCRWLLLSIDRLPASRLEMTEALVAGMLGTPCDRVAAVAAGLEAGGLIEYRGGAITLLDRAGLERRACECYAVVRRELERLGRLPGRAEALQLSGFIETYVPQIVAEWERFARTLLPAAATLAPHALRGHAKPILRAIACEVAAGRRGVPLPAGETAAAAHGALRQRSGFSLLQLGEEYRALRASVITLWRAHLSREGHAAALEDLTCFNASLAHALAQSIASFADELARSSDTFLAVLGHDLRTPLLAVSLSGRYLSAEGRLGSEAQRQALAHIERAAANMDAMIRELLEYAGTRLRGGIPVARLPCDLRGVCESALDEMRAGHPEREFRLEASGALEGAFDAGRLQRVFANLLGNAVQHGAASSRITLEAHGGAAAVTVRVKNQGPPIPPDALQVIFNPLVRAGGHAGPLGARPSTSLGLGLFIARNIVLAHGGSLEVECSDEAGTVFTARLPRGEAQAGARPAVAPGAPLRMLVVDDNRLLAKPVGLPALQALLGPAPRA